MYLKAAKRVDTKYSHHTHTQNSNYVTGGKC